MTPIPNPTPINPEEFNAHGNPSIKYGLPDKVEHCIRCAMSNQRPSSAVEYKHTADSSKVTIAFNGQGICDACLYAAAKDEIDWEARERELKELCDRFRSRNGHYDCLVPGSGGKDSFYQSWLLKYKYNMNPLTVTWAPHIYTPWGFDNFQNWIHSGFDNYLITPNGRGHRLLTRLALENILHPFQPFFFGQKNMPLKIAKLMNIPLIFYGENEAEYGNAKQENESAIREAKYYTRPPDDEVFLSGVPLPELKKSFGLTDSDLAFYLPDQTSSLGGIETHYLGFYERWHPQEVYYHAAANSKFKPSPERTPGTYSKYNSIDDKMDDLHFYTYFIKFGMGRTYYDACQEVRNGDLDRDEAVSLIKKYDGEYPSRFLDELLDYLSIHETEYGAVASNFETPVIDKIYFDQLCDSFRSPHLWIYEQNTWRLRYEVS